MPGRCVEFLIISELRKLKIENGELEMGKTVLFCISFSIFNSSFSILFRSVLFSIFNF